MPGAESLLRDLRYAARVLRRSPAFTATAVLTLGVAIAANTAVFSVADAVLLRPLPYPQPERLATVTTRVQAKDRVGENASQDGATWDAIRDHATTVERAVFSRWTTGVNLVTGRRAVYVHQQRVGAGFFKVLGVMPLIGREFSADEDRPNGPAVAVLSYELWRSLSSGDTSVVGKPIMLRGEPHAVIGVMPEGFQTGDRADLWTPLRPSRTGEGGGDNYSIVARLPPAVSWAQADAEIRQVGTVLEREKPVPAGVTRQLVLTPFQKAMTEDLRAPLLMLWAAVGIVLLVACVNLAGLLLARASGRTREVATRMALGSGRATIVRQLLVESLLIGALGGVLGLLLGSLALDGLRALAADVYQIWQPVSLDGRAVAVAAGLAVVASVTFGLAPAVHATRLDVQAAMTEAGARSVAGTAQRWPRRVVIVSQVALGVVLLIAAGLLVRTYSHLRHLTPGFDPNGVLAVSVSLEDARYREASRVNQMAEETLRRIRETPGVDSAAVVLGLPYERLLNIGFRHLDGAAAGADARITNATYVTPEYFRALRIPIREGRAFERRDTSESAGVVIVSERFVQRYFEGASPIGRRIAFAGRDREVIGIAGDVQAKSGWGGTGPIDALPLAYIPLAQASNEMLRLVHGWFAPSFVVRAAGGPAAITDAVRKALDATDPLLPFADVRQMAAVQAESVTEQRLLMVLLAGLAATTVVLAGIGIHGLIATSVTERAREMGIRMALGATIGQALRALALPGVMLAVVGTLVGAGAAMLSARLLRYFVWGVRETDPLTYVSVAAILLAVATISSVVPAWKIVRLDPAKTLREE